MNSLKNIDMAKAECSVSIIKLFYKRYKAWKFIVDEGIGGG